MGKWASIAICVPGEGDGETVSGRVDDLAVRGFRLARLNEDHLQVALARGLLFGALGLLLALRREGDLEDVLRGSEPVVDRPFGVAHDLEVELENFGRSDLGAVQRFELGFRYAIDGLIAFGEGFEVGS